MGCKVVEEDDEEEYEVMMPFEDSYSEDERVTVESTHDDHEQSDEEVVSDEDFVHMFNGLLNTGNNDTHNQAMASTGKHDTGNRGGHTQH